MTSPNPVVGRHHAWLMAAYYFFFYGAFGCFLTYLPLYYQHIGLPGEKIGLLVALSPVVLFVSGPLWGAIADRFNLHRWLLPLATFSAIGPVFLFPLTRDLSFLIPLVLVQAFFSQAIGPLMDSAALDIAGKTKTDFGQVRLGGSVGFMVISVIVGWLITNFGLEWLFYSYMTCMAIAGLIALALPARAHHWQAPLWQGLRNLLSKPPLVFFLVAAFLVGVAANAVQFFFPIYLTDLGSDANLVGIAGALAALTEVPVLYSGNRIVRKVGGLWIGVVLGACIYASRWFLLSFMANPVAATLTQALHGFSFGLFYVAGVAFVDANTPDGLSATAQSLFFVAMWGLGAAAGSVLGGMLYQNFGPFVLFQVCGLCTLVAIGLLFGARPAAQTRAVSG